MTLWPLKLPIANINNPKETLGLGGFFHYYFHKNQNSSPRVHFQDLFHNFMSTACKLRTILWTNSDLPFTSRDTKQVSTS